MKNKITAYGELLMRLTPAQHGNLIEQSDALEMSFAGAEANILADLSLLGHRTGFVTALPQNPLGRKAEQFLRGFGIDTDAVVWDGGRLGTYYIEHGFSIRGTRVTYDRKDSSVSNAKLSENNWETILDKTAFFVLTGVTPALSQTCRDNVDLALRIAKDKGIKVLFDLNYRRSLWTKQEARSAFEIILPYVDVLLGNVGSAYDVFDIQTPPIEDYPSLKIATQMATDALERLGDFEWMAMTMRLQSDANNNVLGGMVKKAGQHHFSRALQTRIVDRLGGGDAFAAAILHGILKDWKAGAIVDLAAAAFAVTQTLQGDINYLTEQELLDMASGNVRGHVRR